LALRIGLGSATGILRKQKTVVAGSAERGRAQASHAEHAGAKKGRARYPVPGAIISNFHVLQENDKDFDHLHAWYTMRIMMKKRRYILITGTLLIVALLAYAFIFTETREEKIERLNKVANTLPYFNGHQISSKNDADGECEEISDSSALPALRYKQPLTTEEYQKARVHFVQEAEKKGIDWRDSPNGSSNVFERDGKKYKLRFVTYSAPADYYGIDLTACN
jgi:hypothetical protein